MKKVIIAGSRTFIDYELLKNECDKIIKGEGVEIVSGIAQGADRLGLQYAKEKSLSVKKFPANWDLHGISAGHIRNAEMADYADTLIAFWDGVSRGTEGMIDVAKKRGLEVFVILGA